MYLLTTQLSSIGTSDKSSTYNNQQNLDYDINSSSSGGSCRFHNPKVFSSILFVFLKMLIEICELFRKNISFGDYVESTFGESVLHLKYIDWHPILSSEFIRHGKMINFLKLIQTFIEVSFAWLTGPKNVPIMRVWMNKI
jgi:hypothetical protein